MQRTLLRSAAGEIVLPDPPLISREDGGHLVVNPPRDVWDRTELTPDELTRWTFLVNATAKAMMRELPQLDGGCINYWDAGNWALHDDADPKGPKRGETHRHLHFHLFGRSRNAKDPSWRWGEAPRFPDFADRHAWCAKFEQLNEDECRRIVNRIREEALHDQKISFSSPSHAGDSDVR